MREKFYRFLTVEADFFAAIFFWIGLAIVVVDAAHLVVSILVGLLGAETSDVGDLEGITGLALLTLSFLLHKTQKTPDS